MRTDFFVRNREDQEKVARYFSCAERNQLSIENPVLSENILHAFPSLLLPPFLSYSFPFLLQSPFPFWSQTIPSSNHQVMAPHSSTLAWKSPWTAEPGRLQSMGSLRVGHDWETSLSLFTSLHWRRKWQLTPVFWPGESQGWGGAWWAAVYGVAQSRTRLKQLSSSSSNVSLLQTLWAYYICFPIYPQH